MSRRIILIALALLVMLPAGIVLVEHWRGHTLLAATIAELRSRGETLDLLSLTSSRVPIGSNGMDALLAAAARLEVHSELAPPPLQMVGPGRAAVGSRLERWAGAGGRQQG